MIWIDAIFYVTCVTNIKTFGDWPDIKFVRKSMCASGFTEGPETTITVSAASRPYPATAFGHGFKLGFKSFL